MKELDVEEIDRICGNIGKKVHQRFPETPADDLAQEVWMWVAEHQDEVLEWASEVAGGLIETTGSTARLYRRGFRVATAYAKRERAVMTGYEPHDEFYYSLGILRRVLPLYFEEMESSAFPEELVVPDRDIVLDLGRAFGVLEGDAPYVLQAMFSGDPDEQETYAHLAHYYGITPESAEKKVSRALASLRRVLGGPNPYFDGKGRKAISNARAQFITAQQEQA